MNKKYITKNGIVKNKPNKYLLLVNKINNHASQEIQDKEFTIHLMSERLNENKLNHSIWNNLSNEFNSFSLFKIQRLDPTYAIVMVDIDYLLDHRGNRINQLSYKSTDNIKKLIKSGKKLDSVPVFDLNTNKVEEGNHRIQALKKLGFESVPIFISGGW